MTEESYEPIVEMEEPKKNNTPLIIGIVVFVVLCCCCSLVAAAWFGGDYLVELFESFAMNFLPAAAPLYV